MDYKENSETRKYFEKIGAEYRQGCYNEGNAETCHLFGDFLETIKLDYSKAATVYRTNCDDKKFAKSCTKFAAYSFLGKGNIPEDGLKAYDYYKKGCEYGDPDSCLNAGLMNVVTSSRNKKERDFKLGLKLLEQSCEGKNAFGCHYISGMYIFGVKGPNDEEDVAKDMKKAHYYAEEACKLGNTEACINVSIMFRKGEGVDKDEIKADYYKKLAIEMQEEALQQSRKLKLQEVVPD